MGRVNGQILRAPLSVFYLAPKAYEFAVAYECYTETNDSSESVAK